MTPAKFNPYDPPHAELPAQPKSAKRVVTFGEVVIVAWIFSILVAIEVSLLNRSGPILLDLIINTSETALIILAVTVAPVLTMTYAVVRVVRAIRQRREGSRHLR